MVDLALFEAGLVLEREPCCQFRSSWFPKSFWPSHPKEPSICHFGPRFPPVPPISPSGPPTPASFPVQPPGPPVGVSAGATPFLQGIDWRENYINPTKLEENVVVSSNCTIQYWIFNCSEVNSTL